MENASEALHMAFGVLIFVLALSISISLFGQVRATSQYIIDANDRENEYIYIEGNDTSRIVGAETIVPAMYRAYKENYVIVFKGLENLTETTYFKNNGLYKKRVGNGDVWEDVYSLNLAESNLAIKNNKDAIKFVDKFLNGELTGQRDSEFPNIKSLNNRKFYDIIKEKQFKETLGLYYLDDVIPEGETSDILSSDVNKTEKRVITYELQ